MTASPSLPVALCDYEDLARERLSPMAAAYLEGGAADEITLRENRAAFDRLKLSSRVLRDMSRAGTGLRLLGMELEHPILVAPVAFHRLFHPEGERATVAGAGTARAAMVVSTQASVMLEEIAADARAPLLFQLYIQPDRAFTHALVQRAEAAGYRAIVVTVDAPASLRNREQRVAFRLPPGIEAVNLRGMATASGAGGPIGSSPLFSGFLQGAATWEDIARLRAVTRLPSSSRAFSRRRMRARPWRRAQMPLRSRTMAGGYWTPCPPPSRRCPASRMPWAVTFPCFWTEASGAERIS